MPNEPTKMWAGRFREPLNQEFEEWQRSFPFDWRLLPQEIAASVAHAKTIAAAGILTPDELTQTIRGLSAVKEPESKPTKIRSARFQLTGVPPKLFGKQAPIVFEILKGAAEPMTASQIAKLAEGRLVAVAGVEPSVVYHLGLFRKDGVVKSVGSTDETAEDIHHFTELQLTKIIGSLALKLHTGRSRNEQIATDMRLFVRDSIDATMAALKAWALALIELAESAGEAVIPSYTHLQRAEPVLVAHWLLAYVSMIERDISRLTDARARMNFCPLGSGAVAGATLALDRTIAAEALGFSSPTANSLDATSDRDFLLDFTQALSTLGLHISRFAEELTLYATAEFGFVDLPEAFSTGSSAMPQKKNPDLTELIRGKSARLLGASVTLATLIKGLPLAYNKDLQEGQEPVFDAADTIAGILSVLPAFTRSLKFNFPRMKSAATTGYLNAMAAATYLSNKGVPFRKAHEIVGNAVRLAMGDGGLESNRELNALTLPELQQLSDAFSEDFFASITLEATLDCHDVLGGTNRTRVATALAVARTRITALTPE
jgi:argininosuccinate lyase